jgi:glycine/D-amino acid oxidase-like deaminating enzyme
MLRSAADHKLVVEQISTREAGIRWPGYRLPESFSALFEQRAGYLMVEDCVMAHAHVARSAGAELRCDVAVRGWKVNNRGVTVETDTETLSADRLVITAGAWANEMLPSLKVPFTILRKPLFWYRSDNPAHLLDAECPCFLFETLGGIFYGFPQRNNLGVKLAEHTGGTIVDDPFHVDRTLHSADQRRVEECLAEHLPGATTDCAAHAVCMYTMSPDGHFVLGKHPEHSQVVFTAGLSGHGFKFTSVLGEIMADLALDGETKHPIEFLSPTRFSMNSTGVATH